MIGMLIREIKHRRYIRRVNEEIRVLQVRTRAIGRAVRYEVAKERVKTYDEFMSIEDLRKIMRRPLEKVKP